jgi:ring-1,2-phenylacetyl-CoA epoxidase subunit PaaD
MVTMELLDVAGATHAAEGMASQSAHRGLAGAWDALAAVVDPEIPIVSIVELGIVRGVRFDGATLVVDTTPTYSGCPATDVIAADIGMALRAAGFSDYRIATRLAPPWSSDWLAPEAKCKLRAFGIAPPHATAFNIDVAGISPLRRRAAAIPCPRCGSARTRLVAQFGSTACKAQYRCDVCAEPFDYFKPH